MKGFPPPGPIYAIADLGALGGERFPATVETLAAAGIRWIQIRAKSATGAQLYRLLERTSRALEGTATALWLDDRADLAALFPVAGVHVGQRDLPPSAVKGLLGEGIRVGLSTHDRSQFLAAAADGAVDVIAVGPIFPTRSKENPDPAVGLDFLRWARRRTDKPLVAIGGIDAETLPEVLGAGADTAALIGALCRGDVESNCRRLVAALRGWG